MEELLMFLARGLVVNKDFVKVKIEKPLSDGTVSYKICVDYQDVGRLIGKQGRIAKAIRRIVRASDIRRGTRSLVQIGEDDNNKNYAE